MPRYRISEPIARQLFLVNGLTFPHTTGQLYWDSDDRTLVCDLYGDNVSLQIGQETHVFARNNTGAQITNGQVVYVSGAQGNRPTVALARADEVSTAVVIAVATEDVDDNSDGYFTTFGLVRDMNTNSFNAGDRLYLSASTAGAMNNAVPASPNNFTVPLGLVLVKNPSEGVIFFDPRKVSAFGDIYGTDYTKFESDGTIISFGAARCWRDELQSLIGQRLESPGSDIVQNNAEGTLTFKTSAALIDYVTMNVQLNHDRVLQTAVSPHLHWFQTTAATPNWLIQYRIQYNGQAKTTAWTSAKWSENKFAWTAGTLNQITDFADITPGVTDGVSTIIQFRIIRDNANGSGLFAGADPVAVSVDAMNFDVHIEVDMFGSRTEYTK